MHDDQSRWSKEAQFFDDEEYAEGPIPESTIQRYRLCLHPYSPAEQPFAILGDVRGKRIFELGCGDGGNAVLFALNGAQVVGVDVSPRAIAIAKNRARLHGVEDRIEFHALPVEVYLERFSAKFDIVCGFAVLHHLLPVLDQVLANLIRLQGVNTTFLFVEPIAISGWLRRLRLMLPIALHGTPDERPLDAQDLATILRHLPGAELHAQLLLARLWSRFLGGRVEDYSALRRALYFSLCRIDHAVLSLPGARVLAGSGVIVSRPKGTAQP